MITPELYTEYRKDKRLISYDDGSAWYLEYNLENKTGIDNGDR